MHLVFAALAAGVWTVLGAPRLLLTIYLLTVVVAAPFGLAMAAVLQRNLTHAEPIAPGAREAPLDWWESVGDRGQTLASTFTPAILGLAAPLDNLSAVFDASPRPRAVLAGAAAYGALWILLWGGVLDRFARGKGGAPIVRAAFEFAAPMARLTVVGLLGYALIFFVVRPVLTLVVPPLALYVLVGALVAMCHVIVDYARVRTVVENRRSTAAALGAAVEFVRGCPGQVFVLSLMTGLLFLGLLGAYWAFERITRGVPSAWSAIVVGQAYIVARLTIKLIAAASQMRLFQRAS